MRIALFGGSFDPPHLGHVFAAVHARLCGNVDAVWVLPVANHPYGKALSPWAQRLQLTQAAFADLPFVSVRSDELDNPQGHSITLIERLSGQYPDYNWLLVGGTDTADDLPNWHRGAELAKLIRVHPVPRRGWDDDHLGALPALSSSMIRQRLDHKLSINGLVPSAVEQLIHQHQWYGNERQRTKRL